MANRHFGPYTVEITNPEKVLFPDDDLSKRDLIDYYDNIAEVMLPHIKDRPLTLQRFPDGLDAEGFYQQRRADYFPDWLQSVKAPLADGDGGESMDHILCNNRASLVYLANQAAITLHNWLSRAPDLKKPDRLIFDLDPDGTDFAAVKQAAKNVMEIMRQTGLTPYIKTTGSRGLHVLAPLKPAAGFDVVRALAKDMAEWLAAEYADELTVQHRKDKRKGRVYLDIMRNSYGQTAVAPYSVRCKPGAPVATPLSLEELDDPELSPQSYHLGNILRRLGQKEDPWRDMERHQVDPETVRRKLDTLLE